MELTEEQQKFMDAIEKEFHDRFTESDGVYWEEHTTPLTDPPIIEPWYNKPRRKFDFGRRGRGGDFNGRNRDRDYSNHRRYDNHRDGDRNRDYDRDRRDRNRDYDRDRRDFRGDRGDSRGDRGDSRGDRGDSRGDRGDSRGDRGDSRGDRGDSRGDRGRYGGRPSHGDNHGRDQDYKRQRSNDEHSRPRDRDQW